MPVPKTLAGRIAALVAAAVLLLLVLAQIFLPGIGEGAIAERLTENGGSAEVSLDAFPAARLLWGAGDGLRVAGQGLELELEETNPEVFADLDRFDSVDIEITDSRIGPIALEDFSLARDGDTTYALATAGSTSGAALAEFVARDSGVPGSDLLGGIVGATGIGAASVPLDLDMELASDDGRARVVSGSGEVAGVPAGPLATAITNAILAQL